MSDDTAGSRFPLTDGDPPVPTCEDAVVTFGSIKPIEIQRRWSSPS